VRARTTLRVRLPALLALGIAAALARPAAAQFPPEVRGRVVARAGGAPVAGARVEVVDGDARAVAGADGAFVLRGLVPGTHELRARALGYRERRARVEAVNGQVTRVVVELDAVPALLDRVVVTDSGSRGAAGATVFARADVERSGARDVGELVEDAAGVVVTRRGGPGSPAHASIRGGSANQVLVLVDGVPINEPLTGNADLSAVPLEAVERVTVLRGAQSARYGGQALSGVIAVETRRPHAGEVGLRLGAGAYGERLAAGSVGGRVRRAGAGTLGGLVTLEHRAVEGAFGYQMPYGAGRRLRRNADATTTSLLASASAERGGVEARLRADLFDARRGMPGSIVQPTGSARQAQRRLGAGATLRTERGRWDGGLELSAQRQRAAYRDPRSPFGRSYDDTATVGSVGATATAGARLGVGASLSLGGELRALGFRASTLDSAAPAGQRIAGAWVNARASRELAAEWRAEAFAGVRADRNSLLRTTPLSPRAGVSLGGRRVVARLSWGSAFSPASLADQFFQEGVQVRANPALRPERVRNEVEAGIELRALRAGGATIEGDVAAYRADVDGMILWFPDYNYVWSPSNFAVRRAGVDASARAAWGSRAELRAGVSRGDVTYAAGGGLVGQVVYRPVLTANGALSVRAFGVRGEAAVRYAGRRRTRPGSAFNTLAPYEMVDLRLARELRVGGGGGWAGEAQLGVDNLLDRGAAMLLDYPFPARSWTLSLRLRRGGTEEGT